MQWFFVAAIVVAALAAWVDWRTGFIPDWLTIGAIPVGFAAHAFYTLAHTGHRLEAGQQAGLSVLGAALCGLIPLALWNANGLGGGDLKLFLALGALLLPLAGLEAELWSFVAAAVIAPVRLAWEGKLFRTVGNAAFLAVNPFLPKARRRELDPERFSWFRMGPAILLGTIWTAYLHLKG